MLPWDEVLALGETTVSAFDQLVSASDALADAIGYRRDYVLGKVMPAKAVERRENRRVTDWLVANELGLRADYGEWLKNEADSRNRAALLARLNLDDEAKRLLGIEDEE